MDKVFILSMDMSRELMTAEENVLGVPYGLLMRWENGREVHRMKVSGWKHGVQRHA